MNKIAEIIDEKRLYIFDRTQFDWSSIRHSGQIFRDPPCEIIDDGEKILITTRYQGQYFDTKGNPQSPSQWLWNYFDLDTDYAEIKKELLRFEVLRESIDAGYGIRILRQPFVETIISFIISANNNIKRISKSVEILCEKFGTKVGNFYSFPTLEQLSLLSLEDFQKIGCGYRSKYLVDAVKILKDAERDLGKFSVKELRYLDNQELMRCLLKIPGIGPKVGACIALFCDDFHRLDVAPVDTWIEKALLQLGENDSNIILRNKYAGVAQQYIFYYLQHLRKNLI
ncbi:MAG: hypothetical protein FWE01_01975 [Firmicutes bacterium]|nr:hypothetical protein [Bacillota bacterium]